MLKSGKRKYEKIQQGYDKLKEQEAKKKKKHLPQNQQKQTEEEWETDEENDKKKQEDEDIEFEDEFDDEFEDEIEVDDNEVNDNNSDNSEMEAEEETKLNPVEQESDYVDIVSSKKAKKKQKKQAKPEAFLGTRSDLKEDEQLEVDNHAYEFLHRANTEWPCLTFDFLLTEQQRCQTVFENKYRYPVELYMVAGTSGANKGHSNSLYVIGMHNLFSTKNDDDSASEDDDNEQEDTQPKLILHSVDTKASVNRVKAWRNTGIVACWQENGDVCVYDLQKEFELALQKQKQQPAQLKKKNKSILTPPSQLVKTFKNPTEGFALSWQNSAKALFATGDNTGKLTLYHGSATGWERDYPLDFCKYSIEDIQFSRTDENILICCATDGSFSGVDIRKGAPTFTCKKAHQQDINVLDWNSANQNLIATGSDDNLVKIWDLRMCSKSAKPTPVAQISWHKGPLTSLNWQPGEESSLVTASVDDRVAIWDFAVEAEGVDEKDKVQGVPEQLMFVHMGVENVREVMWHPVMRDVIVSTAGNGFNAFRPAVQDDVSSEADEEQEIDNKKVIKEEDLDKFLGKMKISN